MIKAPNSAHGLFELENKKLFNNLLKKFVYTFTLWGYRAPISRCSPSGLLYGCSCGLVSGSLRSVPTTPRLEWKRPVFQSWAWTGLIGIENLRFLLEKIFVRVSLHSNLQKWGFSPQPAGKFPLQIQPRARKHLISATFRCLPQYSKSKLSWGVSSIHQCRPLRSDASS